MTNYRLLREEEFEYFDEEFKQFLIVNGIDNEEWLKLHQEAPDKARGLLQLFSTSVFQKSLSKLRYLEFRSQKKWLVFNCELDKIELIGLETDDEKVDFSSVETTKEALLHRASKIRSFSSSKPYNKERELELFEMTENGCLVSNEKTWQELQTLIS